MSRGLRGTEGILKFPNKNLEKDLTKGGLI